MFNLADSAIVCGGVLGALLALRGIDLDGTRVGAKSAATRAATRVAAPSEARRELRAVRTTRSSAQWGA